MKWSNGIYQHNVQILHQLTTTLMVYGHQRATVKGWTSGDDKWQDTQFANCATALMLLILSSYLRFQVQKQHHTRFCRMHKKTWNYRPSESIAIIPVPLISSHSDQHSSLFLLLTTLVCVIHFSHVNSSHGHCSKWLSSFVVCLP